MASAQKLPSGAWRTRATKLIDGKKITKSFTTDPRDFGGDWRKAKRESERLADNWMADCDYEMHTITVRKAIESYIADRSNVLSPSTIAGYDRMSEYFKDILDMNVQDITSKTLQAIINEWALDIGAKTIKNRIYFLTPVLSFAGVEKRFNLRFPKRVPKELLPPEQNEFHRLLSAAKDNEQKLTLVLGGLYTLRRSEICGIKGNDILRDMQCIYIHRAMVKDKNGKWVLKEYPKTDDSIRLIKIGADIMKLIPEIEPDEFLVKTNPNMITKNFGILRKKVCVTCRFHDLRKYAASIRSDVMPAKYVKKLGGWKSSSTVFTSVYDKPFKEKLAAYQDQFNESVIAEYGKELFG